jgi:Immunoglobulin I-set domain
VWRRENDELMFTKGSSYSGYSLYIAQVKKEDRGRYICEVSNGIGEAATKSVLLEVSFGPLVASKRPKTGQSTGYEAELICKVTSYPPAAVSWTRHDKELNNSDNYEISYLGVTNEETISTLRFKSVAHHDFGQYICKAKNIFGAAETALELFGKEIQQSQLWHMLKLCSFQNLKFLLSPLSSNTARA